MKRQNIYDGTIRLLVIKKMMILPLHVMMKDSQINNDATLSFFEPASGEQSAGWFTLFILNIEKSADGVLPGF
jgi:hypothetical protein